MNRSMLIRISKILLPLLVLALVYWEGANELKQIHLGQIVHDVLRLHTGPIVQILLLSLFSVSVMSSYDMLIRHQFKLKVSIWTAFRLGWIANTFNNVLGFAGFTGAGVRALLYKNRDVPTATMTAAIIFLSPMMIIGLSLLSWMGISGGISISPLLAAHEWLVFAVWGMAFYLPVFLFIQRSSLFAKWFNHNEGKLAWRIIGASLGASLMEWFFAGLTFWVIIHQFVHTLTLSEALGVFTISAIAGLISMAPGGIGTFDLTALLGLQLYGVHTDKALAILVIFRLFYYIIPFVIGLTLAALELLPDRKRMNELASTGWEQSLNAWQKVWSWPGQFAFLSDFSVWALSKLILVSGIVLLVSAATPGILHRLRFMEDLLSLPVMKVSHLLSFIIGLILIILSRGISHRIHRAYSLTLIMLLFGAVFTLAKGFDYEEASFLILVALLLWTGRSRFYRKSFPYSRKSIFAWFILTVLIACSYDYIGIQAHPGFLKHLPYGWRSRLFLSPNEFILSAVVGVAAVWIFISLLLALQPSRQIGKKTDSEELAKLQLFLEREKGNLLTHMLFLGDKSFFWAQKGRVLLGFTRVRDKLVVLGDPLGEKSLIGAAIQEFQKWADQYTLVVVFYQVTPDHLSIYHEHGYRFFKLGEEALVDLQKFTLAGKSNATLRGVKNRFEREGYKFEVIEHPFQAEFIDELKIVSDLWLDGRKEKGFSLGWFQESYLQLAPIAVLRNAENELIAFATMAPSYDDEITISIDLMRHLPNTPNGTMDYLFAALFEWSKKMGYQKFNLGMAPLFTVGQSQSAMREEKIARLVFQHGGRWYSFKGLQRYKEKFSPQWEPRFLAYPAASSLTLLTLELVRLVSKKVDVNDK